MKMKRISSFLLTLCIASATIAPTVSFASAKSIKDTEIKLDNGNIISLSNLEESETSNNDQEKVVLSFSDYEFMQAMKSSETDLTAIFSSKKGQNNTIQQRAVARASYGQNKVVKVRNGYYKIYLSSFVIDAVKAGSMAALTALLSPVLGPAGAAIASFLVSTGYDSSRGAVFSWRKVNGAWQLSLLGGQ